MLAFANEASEAFAHLRSLFKDLSYTRRPNQRYERVIVSQQEHPEWASYVRILTPSAQETWKDYTVFKSVTWVGRHGQEVPPGWLVLPESGRTDVMVPEFTLDWFNNNRKALKVLLDLMQWKNEGNGDVHPTLNTIFPETDRIEQLASVFAMMSDSGDVEAMEEINDGLWNMAKRMEEDLNQRISAGMETASLDLTGSDMLAALADAATFQRKLASATEDVITDILEQGRSELSAYLEASGLQAPFDLYASNWPVDSIDPFLTKLMMNLSVESTTVGMTISSVSPQNLPTSNHCVRPLSKGLLSMICGTALLPGLCITMQNFQNWFITAFGLKTVVTSSSTVMSNP